MELSDGFRGVGEVLQRFPGALVRTIALPMNEILYFPTPDARVQDFFHFPFHVILQFYRRRGRLCAIREGVPLVWFQERYVKHRMDAHLRG